MLGAALAAAGGQVSAQVEDAAWSRRRGDRVGEVRTADFVERHGITWRFDQSYATGTFVNGDPWVVGPVTIVEILPRSVVVEGRSMHGSMLDPDASIMLQGYDSELYAEHGRDLFRAALDVAAGVSRQRPLRLEGVCSLVSVRSRAETNVVPMLQGAAVLTCVAEPPAPDAFRPPYVRGDKAMKHRAVDLDFRALARLLPSPGAPAIDVVARGFEKVWLDHFPEWPVRYVHPLDNMPDYGREMAALVGTGALLLNLDVPDEEKRELLVRMVQLGIDLHGCLRGGCRWPGLGGHGHGRKLPILLAGRVLHDKQMLAIGRDFAVAQRPGRDRNAVFGEDTQTFFVQATGEGQWNHGHGGYTREHEGLPDWGFTHANDPTGDAAAWTGNPYRVCCTANGWVGQTLAARILGLMPEWNHPAFFAYMDRYMQVQPAEPWHRAWVPWHAAMWEAYRGEF